MFKKLKKILGKKCRGGKEYTKFKKELMAKFKGVQTKQIKDQLELIIDEAFDYGLSYCLDESYKIALKTLEEIDSYEDD